MPHPKDRVVSHTPALAAASPNVNGKSADKPDISADLAPPSSHEARDQTKEDVIMIDNDDAKAENNHVPQTNTNGEVATNGISEGRDVNSVKEEITGVGANGASSQIASDDPKNPKVARVEVKPKDDVVTSSKPKSAPAVNGLNSLNRQATTRNRSISKAANGSISSPARPPTSLKVEKEADALKQHMGEVDADAVKLASRAHWRHVLFGNRENGQPLDEAHLAFIIKASLKNCPTGVIERVTRSQDCDALLRDPSLRQTLLRQVNAKDFRHIPQDVLDQALVERIRSAPTKWLTRKLGEAGRLGFQPEDADQPDLVAPMIAAQIATYGPQGPQGPIPPAGPATISEYSPVNVPARPSSAVPLASEKSGYSPITFPERPATAVPPSYTPAASLPPPPHPGQQLPQTLPRETHDILLLEQNRNLDAARQAGIDPTTRKRKSNKFSGPATVPPRPRADFSPPASSLMCPYCHQIGFKYTKAYSFHVQKRVCDQGSDKNGKPFTDYCELCGKGFTGKQGLLYHEKKEVCIGAGTKIAEATAPPTQVTPAHTQGSPSQAHTASPQANSQSMAPPSYPPSPGGSPSNQLQQEAAANVPGPPRPPLPPTWVSHGAARASVAIPEHVYQPSLSNGPVSYNTSLQDRPTSQVERLQSPAAGRYRSAQELGVADLAEMNRRIDKVEEDFLARVAAATVEERADKMASWKQSKSSKKSMIRKEYGVTIRGKKFRNDELSTPTVKATATAEKGKKNLAPLPYSQVWDPKKRPVDSAPVSTSQPPIAGSYPMTGPHPVPSPYPVPNPSTIATTSFSPINRTPVPPPPRPGFIAVPHYPGETPQLPAEYTRPPPYTQAGQTNKRRRTDTDFKVEIPSAATQQRQRSSLGGPSMTSSKLDMVEVGQEDADSTMAAQNQERNEKQSQKKVLIHKDTQARWEALNGGKRRESTGMQKHEHEDTPMTDAEAISTSAAPLPASNVITLSSSEEPQGSEQEPEQEPEPESTVVVDGGADRPLPSVEKENSEDVAGDIYPKKAGEGNETDEPYTRPAENGTAEIVNVESIAKPVMVVKATLDSPSKRRTSGRRRRQF